MQIFRAILKIVLPATTDQVHIPYLMTSWNGNAICFFDALCLDNVDISVL